MKVIRLFAGAVPALVFAGLAVAQSAGTENLGCSNSTLIGSYAFQITGQILAPAAVAGPVGGVALTVFDGLGNLTQVDNVVHNGVVPVEDWRPAVGTYTVNTNCTGTFTFAPQPTNPADAAGADGPLCGDAERLGDPDNGHWLAQLAGVRGGDHQYWREVALSVRLRPRRSWGVS